MTKKLIKHFCQGYSVPLLLLINVTFSRQLLILMCMCSSEAFAGSLTDGVPAHAILNVHHPMITSHRKKLLLNEKRRYTDG